MKFDNLKKNIKLLKNCQANAEKEKLNLQDLPKIFIA